MRCRTISSAAAAALLLIATSSAGTLPARSSESPPARYLSLDVGSRHGRPVRKRDSPEWRNLVRRADHAVGVILDNEDSYYSTELSLGTPPQKVSVILDTGSSELWVDPDCSQASTSDEQATCQQAGQYDPDSSSTPPVGPFGGTTISYGDPTDPSTQTAVQLVYYADTLTLGTSVSVKNQTFGVVRQSSGLFQGILGLAPDLQDGFAPGKPYSYVLNSLASQAVIPSRVFSLDLRHSTDTSGALIYGGYDKNRFAGPLVPRPLVRGLSNEFRLAVDLTGVTVTGVPASDSRQDIAIGTPEPALLDSGTTLTRLDPDTAASIAKALGAQPDTATNDGYYVVDCSVRSQSGASVDFRFGSATVRVPMADFVLDLGPDTSGQQCYLGLTETQDLAVLGDSVLRAGYFVFDWDNERVHIAQAATCGSGQDVTVVGSGSDAVQDASGNCNMGIDTAVGVGDGDNAVDRVSAAGGALWCLTMLAAGMAAMM